MQKSIGKSNIRHPVNHEDFNLILTLNGSNDVFLPKEVPFGGQEDGWRHMGKIPPKTPQKGAWIGSFKPKRKIFYIAISPELLIRRTSDLRTEFRPRKGISWVVRHYPKANITWLTAAILKMDITSYFSDGCSDLDEIRQPDAEWHADYGEMIEIETGSKIPIWRTFVFRNRK